MPDDSQLLTVLESLRQRGAIGEVSLDGAIEHATAFVAALPPSCRTIVDLGSGGGLPGLVIAVRRPDVTMVLTDRRERRMDLLRLACAQLGVSERVSVETADVTRLGRDPRFAERFDVVTARAFGEPMWTLECARRFVRPGGTIIVSEPPATAAERWPIASIAALQLSGPVRLPFVAVFTRLPS